MTQRLHCQMFTLFLSYAMECHLIKHRGSRTAVSKPEPRQPALMFAVAFPARRSAQFPRGIERFLRRGVARLFFSDFDIPSALRTSSCTQTSILGATHLETGLSYVAGRLSLTCIFADVRRPSRPHFPAKLVSSFPLFLLLHQTSFVRLVHSKRLAAMS